MKSATAVKSPSVKELLSDSADCDALSDDETGASEELCEREAEGVELRPED